MTDTPWIKPQEKLPNKDCEVIAHIIHYYKNTGGGDEIKELSSTYVLNYKKALKGFVKDSHGAFFMQKDNFEMTGLPADSFDNKELLPKLALYFITPPEID